MNAYEKDIKDLIQKMQMQQGYMKKEGEEKLNSLSSNFSGGTDQSPHLVNNNANSNSVDQSPANPINSVRPMGKPISVTRKTDIKRDTAIPEGACPQCGIIHPPLPPGARCPMASVKVKTQDGNEKEVDINKFLVDLKNIILSQSDSKKIKDLEKLFKNIILETTKYLESYKE
jgi:hypothetical protein